MPEHQVHQRLLTDIMHRTRACILSVLRAIKEVLAIVEVLGRAVIELLAAIRAKDLSGEDADLARCRRSALVFAYLLYNLVGIFINDGRVGV